MNSNEGTPIPAERSGGLERWADPDGAGPYGLLFDRWITRGQTGAKERATRLVRSGTVTVDVEAGFADALVVSPRKVTHRVLIEVNRFTKNVWTTLAEDIAVSPRATAMFYAGQLDYDVLSFGKSFQRKKYDLVPWGHDVRVECECGRRHSYCEHALAALVRMVDPLDDLRLLVWRGGGADEIEAQIRVLRIRVDTGMGANRSWVRDRASRGAYPSSEEAPSSSSADAAASG